jgi:uncharacterized phage-associated protein
MAYPTMAVANAFIQRARESKLSDLSPMKLQKLLFFAQSWHLKWRNEPLIDDAFCRWQYGPVIPSLYHEFKHYGSQPIDRFGTFVSPLGAIEAIVPEQDKDTWHVLDEVIRAYGSYSATQLSSVTHRKGSAWEKTGGPDGGPIPHKMLAECIS